MEITLSLPMLLFLMLMTGFAGFVDSAAGGGGLISLPAYLFAGLPPHYTYGTNKFSAACGTTFATANFFKNGAMNLKVGILAAIGSFAGSALGAHIVLLLSDELLRTMMFLILPVAAVVILWQRDLPDQNRDDGTLNLKKILLALGIGLGSVSAALARWAFATLRRAGTSGNPRQDSQQLVRHGPFAWSRNPVYVAMTGLYASLAVLADSAWFWWLLPPLLLAMHHGVIRREETYLLARFGPPYADYLQQVRRWL